MRKPPDKRNAAPMGSIIGSGVDFRHGSSAKVTVPETYTVVGFCATELAASLVGRRYRLSPPRARLVCHLAGLGGAA